MKNTTKSEKTLDDFGRLTEPMAKNAPTYNARAIRDYCRKNNKSTSEMTFKEFEMFRTDK